MSGQRSYGTGGTGTEQLKYWGNGEQVRCDSVVVRMETGNEQFVLSGLEESYCLYCPVIRLVKC